MRYNTARDKYIRISDGNQETEDWEKCVFTNICMIRKHELDWQMVRSYMYNVGALNEIIYTAHFFPHRDMLKDEH